MEHMSYLRLYLCVCFVRNLIIQIYYYQVLCNDALFFLTNIKQYPQLLYCYPSSLFAFCLCKTVSQLDIVYFTYIFGGMAVLGIYMKWYRYTSNHKAVITVATWTSLHFLFARI